MVRKFVAIAILAMAALLVIQPVTLAQSQFATLAASFAIRVARAVSGAKVA